MNSAVRVIDMVMAEVKESVLGSKQTLVFQISAEGI